LLINEPLDVTTRRQRVIDGVEQACDKTSAA
jgi:hypothetical protein